MPDGKAVWKDRRLLGMTARQRRNPAYRGWDIHHVTNYY